jgi:hypothetical protein
MRKPNLKRMGEESNKLLLAFLKTEVDLGLTFASLAEFERDAGNTEHYEQSKRNAVTAAETIERFKERLSAPAKMEIEMLASNLIRLVSTL